MHAWSFCVWLVQYTACTTVIEAQTHRKGVYNSTCQKAGTTAAWALLGMAIVGSAGTSHRPRVVLTHPRAPTQPSVAGRSHPALERSSLWTLSHDPVDLTEVTCPPSL